LAILIHNCSYLVQSPTCITQDVDLIIQGNRIAQVGKNLATPADAEILDGSDCVVMPGFINTHAHLYQNLMKGISKGIPLVPWCNDVLFPNIGAMRKIISKDGPRLPYLWTVISAIEMIKGGITSCINMDTIFPSIIYAWKDVGFRGVLAYTLSNKWVPEELRSSESAMKDQMMDFITEHHDPHGLTTVFPAPSTLFLCTDDFLQWAGKVAVDNHLGMQIHIAETAEEVSDLVRDTGRTPVEYLDHLGLLNNSLSAVHCVHCSQHDIQLLAQTKAQVVHCPKSNMKLSDGIAPIVPMRKMDILVSLATDGCASNDLLDMWEEMRAAVMLARVANNDANAMQPIDAFQMATVNAAQVAHLDVGEIYPGKLADVIVVDTQAAHLAPFHDFDLFNMLVFCAKSSDVRDTIINGEIVMRNRVLKTVDEAAIKSEIKAIDIEISGFRQDLHFSAS
jgi:5-methylthioadenosine/S-adenosylhomocysteine deaminase